jgi:hypothetical protein
MSEASEELEDILAEARAELQRENTMSQSKSSNYAEASTDPDDL